MTSSLLRRAALALAASACAFPSLAADPPAASTKQAKPAATAKPAAKPAARAASSKPKPRAIDPLDWPMWRGPEQNGISRETGLVDKWDPATDENVLWKNPELGGISSPIVLGGKLFTIVRDQPGTTREREKVVCVDAATGQKLWENAFNVFLTDVPAERVGWSSCVADPTTGYVYAMGVCGYFQCLDGETGQTIWSRSLNEEFGLVSTYGGRTNVPVVFDDLVITSAVITGWGDMARPAHRFLAFDKLTGEPVWFNGTRPLPEDTTYSTPFLTAVDGQAAMIFGSSDGAVHAFQPRTGKPIWKFQVSRRGLNVSPLVADNKVFTAHGEENTDNVTMGAILSIDATKSGDVTQTGELWRAGGMVSKSSPVLVDGRLYAFDDGARMYVLDANTGEEICPPVRMVGTILRASPVYADGKIFICTTSAWHIFEPTDSGAKLIHRLRLAPEDEVSGSIAISHGRIYLPTGAQMYCLGTKDAQPAAAERPAPPQEAPLAKNDEPAQLQIVPCELLLRPGEARQLTVRLFNARGQLLPGKPDAVKFSLAGPGEIDQAGQYVAASTPEHTATIVTAALGKLKGQARIRVVPNLPWKFAFAAGEVPVTWVGARHRHIIREVDGEQVMVKVTTIPKGTRSQCWMGHTDLHDYTVEADLRGAQANNKLPDMGVIAQRYTLDLMGSHQQLQIRSWTSQLSRFSKTVPYPWRADTWYRLKFRAAVEDGKAVLKGKVWPRDEQEPEGWTIEAVDETPNVTGSPGLFGNASDAEIFIDNVAVTANG